MVSSRAARATVAGEFTSKVVARLQALHSCQQLLKSLGVLKHWKQTGSLNTLRGWPCPNSREQELFLRDGPLVHFCVPVQAPLQELSCDPTSSSAAACSLLARSCIAGLWRAHHAWGRCRLSFAFTCGAVVTVTRRFKGRFQGRRATEYCVLKELRELVDAALQERMQKGNLAKAAMPGRRACTVQLPTNGLLPTLPYRRDGTLQLHLESRSDMLCRDASEVSASELLQASLRGRGWGLLALVIVPGSQKVCKPRWRFWHPGQTNRNALIRPQLIRYIVLRMLKSPEACSSSASTTVFQKLK